MRIGSWFSLVSRFVDRIPHRKSPPTDLIRPSQRIGGPPVQPPLDQISQRPLEIMEPISVLLKGGPVGAQLDPACSTVSRPPPGLGAGGVRSVCRSG